MAERERTLADVLMGRNALDPLPSPSGTIDPPSMRSHLEDVHGWFTRNVLEPAQYAMFYPPRVLGRYMDPTGQDPFWRGNLPGKPVATPQDWAALGETLSEIDRARTYQPGTRESDNVVDKRPRSIWSY
jgi:hypothetical protein